MDAKKDSANKASFAQRPKLNIWRPGDAAAVLFASRPLVAGMRRYVPKGAFVAAADAGWHNAAAMGLSIDLFCGDMDSANGVPKARQVMRLAAEKDDTDTHFAARQLLVRGWRRIVLLGALGGRQDHHHANLQTMLHIARHGGVALAADAGCEIWCFAEGSMKFAQNARPAADIFTGADAAGEDVHAAAQSAGKRPWRWLSVYAAGGPARGIALRGVRYPLCGATLLPDVPLGTSNEFCEEVAEVACAEGAVFVMLHDGE